VRRRQAVRPVRKISLQALESLPGMVKRA
jgi:hypothetical protein